MERELWVLLYEVATKLDKPWGCWKYSTADIVGVYFWCVLNDRPMCWSANKANWPDDLCPKCLPPQSTLSRRMRRSDAQQLMTEIEQTWLALVGVSQRLIRVIDGKPLGVSGVSKDADAAYGRSAGGMQKGYKLHAVWGTGPLPLAWGLAPMNRSEKTFRQPLLGVPGLGGVSFTATTLHWFVLAVVALSYLLLRRVAYSFTARRGLPSGRSGVRLECSL